MKLLLTTLHAKYVHASLALPCLAAVCQDLPGVHIVIREPTVNETFDRLLYNLYAEEADMVAFSCYVWNVETTLRLATELKLLRPHTVVVLGGPEVSWGADELMKLCPAIDCIVRGEGEGSFREIVALLAAGGAPADSRGGFRSIAGITFRAADGIVATADRRPLERLDDVPSPFRLGLVDRHKPLVYYETARGCPFSCAFCMSSLESGVRSYSNERIRDDLALLMAEGVGTVKLVDRTFNYDAARANDIWAFILDRNDTSAFHFEIAADLLTDSNLALLSLAPADVFRFEIGVQSGAAVTLASVGRPPDLTRLYANIRRLRNETGIVVHLDLIAGLPEEDFYGFLASLAPLFELSPHHIQVEPLKVLKGTAMREIAAQQGYLYSAHPPYKILQTPWLSFGDIRRIELISRLLDLVYNSGRFPAFLHAVRETVTLVRFFADMAAYLDELQLPPQLALTELFRLLWQFSTEQLPAGHRPMYGDALRYDFCRVEYPTGTLPGFMDGALKHGKGRTAGAELGAVAGRLNLPKGSRVRTISASFDHDCRCTPFRRGPVTLRFIYCAVQGKRQQVFVTEA
jgi:anaerobic magnesium-protoporphyrin IX monomethyl ester cyclase